VVCLAYENRWEIWFVVLNFFINLIVLACCLFYMWFRGSLTDCPQAVMGFLYVFP